MPRVPEYRSKPSTIEAVQWDDKNFPECVAFGDGKVRFIKTAPDVMELQLLAGKDGAQDWVPVPVGHWLVNQPGDKSDIWPVEADYFAAKYEPVAADAPAPS
jgi:hypothetical protein